ncbi:unnamed protein product [Calicophoron daubneyi]
MCTQEHAFSGTNLIRVLWEAVDGPNPKLPSPYSDELQLILDGMLTKDPETRLSAAELLRTPYIEFYMKAMVKEISMKQSEDLKNDEGEQGELESMLPSDQKNAKPQDSIEQVVSKFTVGENPLDSSPVRTGDPQQTPRSHSDTGANTPPSVLDDVSQDAAKFAGEEAIFAKEDMEKSLPPKETSHQKHRYPDTEHSSEAYVRGLHELALQTQRPKSTDSDDEFPPPHSQIKARHRSSEKSSTKDTSAFVINHRPLENSPSDTNFKVSRLPLGDSGDGRTINAGRVMEKSLKDYGKLYVRTADPSILEHQPMTFEDFKDSLVYEYQAECAMSKTLFPIPTGLNNLQNREPDKQMTLDILHQLSHGSLTYCEISLDDLVLPKTYHSRYEEDLLTMNPEVKYKPSDDVDESQSDDSDNELMTGMMSGDGTAMFSGAEILDFVRTTLSCPPAPKPQADLMDYEAHHFEVEKLRNYCIDKLGEDKYREIYDYLYRKRVLGANTEDELNILDGARKLCHDVALGNLVDQIVFLDNKRDLIKDASSRKTQTTKHAPSKLRV